MDDQKLYFQSLLCSRQQHCWEQLSTFDVRLMGIFALQLSYLADFLLEADQSAANEAERAADRRGGATYQRADGRSDSDDKRPRICPEWERCVRSSKIASPGLGKMPTISPKTCCEDLRAAA
jgi:hypothetical protein